MPSKPPTTIYILLSKLQTPSENSPTTEIFHQHYHNHRHTCLNPNLHHYNYNPPQFATIGLQPPNRALQPVEAPFHLQRQHHQPHFQPLRL
ncbi:hypothetical protein Hanom_Chr13g01238331 [Helianthus anomalus]